MWKALSRASGLILCMYACLVTQSCPTLCDAVDYSLPGSSVPGDSPGRNTGVGQGLPIGLDPSMKRAQEQS